MRLATTKRVQRRRPGCLLPRLPDRRRASAANQCTAHGRVTRLHGWRRAGRRGKRQSLLRTPRAKLPLFFFPLFFSPVYLLGYFYTYVVRNIHIYTYVPRARHRRHLNLVRLTRFACNLYFAFYFYFFQIFFYPPTRASRLIAKHDRRRV